MACTDIDIYANVKHCAGKSNMPGIRERVFFIKKANITGWPTVGKPADESASLSTIVTASGNFTLASGKTWLELSLSPDASSFNHETQGNVGSKTFNNTVALIAPGTDEEVSGLIAMLNNDDVVILAQQRNGKFRIYGNEAFTTQFSSSQASGAAVASDSAQTTINVSVTDEIPAPFYVGNIVTADGTISGATGAPVAGGG